MHGFTFDIAGLDTILVYICHNNLSSCGGPPSFAITLVLLYSCCVGDAGLYVPRASLSDMERPPVAVDLIPDKLRSPVYRSLVRDLGGIPHGMNFH